MFTLLAMSAGEITGIIIACVVVLALIAVIFGVLPVRIWFRALVSGVKVPMARLIGMKWRGVKVATIVDAYISASKAGLNVTIDELETHVLAKGDAIKDGTAFVGNRTKAKIVKNKLAPPFKTAEFDIIFGKGISQYGCVLDLAVEKGLITKKGSFFKYNDDNIGQGRENTVQYLADNPELADELIAKIKESVKQDS